MLKRTALLIALLIPALAVVAPPQGARAALPNPTAETSFAANAIASENQQTGTSSWRPGPLVADDVSNQIKGYGSTASVAPNGSLTLYVTVNPAQTYTMDVYRLGWYQGTGARLRLHVGPLDGVQQAACVPDPSTGLNECGWAPSYTLAIPNDWTSGIYLVHLINQQGYENNIMFVVRDGRPASFLYQQSVLTDQAYNNYPDDGQTGKSLYDFNSHGANTVAGTPRAVKVSFDRPYAGNGTGNFFIWEVELVRWLERSGYDVTYSTDLDTHANPSRLLSSKSLLVGGHAEYWSAEMFGAAEAARDAGVNLGFFGAEPDAVQVRIEPSTAGVTDRVVVCYKDWTIDPIVGARTTLPWRQWPVGRPEQTLVGVQSTVAMVAPGTNVGFVVKNSSHWAYEGTGLKDGDVIPGLVGYEMDAFMASFPAPIGDQTLISESPYTSTDGRSEVSNASIYTAPSGALVFASGTSSWSWGLDNFDHGVADARVQRITANVLDAFVHGPPVHDLALTAPATAVAGTPFQVTVVAEDSMGHPMPTYAGTVHFASSDASSGAVLPSDSTLSRGQGQFSVTLAKAGTQTLTVSDAARGLSATASITAAAGATRVLGLSTLAQPTAGTAFQFALTATDQFGNATPGYSGTVHFTATDTLPGVSLPTDADVVGGQGTFSATLDRSGAQTITATDTAASAIAGTLQLSVRAAPAKTLSLATAAAPVAGTAFSFTVNALDQFGNTDSAYAGRVHFVTTDTSTGVAVPADSNLTSGQGSFSATLTKAGAQTITATDLTTATVTGNLAVTVIPGAAAVMTLDAPSSAHMDQAFSITVTLRDRFGNVATDYTGRVHFTTTDMSPLARVPADYTFKAADAGRHVFSASLTTPPSQTITARDLANGSLTATSRAIQIALLP